ALIRTLSNCGVDICFTNPGTSEMHFVAALDAVPDVRAVLALFEGVATGAADGYARVAGRPAATLLHLGPGMGNGWANLHNARRGHVPVVNIVGDHATYHRKYDAPLTSDIDGLARAVSGWVRSSDSSDALPDDTADAVAAAQGPPGQVATLILPADSSWSEARGPAEPRPVAVPPPLDDALLNRAADALRAGGSSALLVGGRVVGSEVGLVAATRLAAGTGSKLLAETFPTRLRRGGGLPAIERLGYLAEFAQMQLEGVTRLIVIDTTAPVSFFAYPGRPSDLVPEGCEVIRFEPDGNDPVAILDALADRVGAPVDVPRQEAVRPDLGSGALTAETLANALGALLPADAIVSDESNTSGLSMAGATAGCPPHDWLTLTGGAIGQGLPVATGAALAAPDRPVIALESDGSALYTIQSLWTQARERSNVTTILLNNRSYSILNLELSRVGAEEPGPVALSMLDLSNPEMDFVSIARGLGVAGSKATTVAEFADQFTSALETAGPHLIQVDLEPLF
ncbi:MAG TPA: acetolactate synthase large subunit, partial [Acidimicrobiales bacterium]|nr:acetolactate synthase large subunit [Acidimicrobiales bacterium]